MDEIEFGSLHATARTYQDRHLGSGGLCDRCDHGHLYRRRGSRDVAVYCRSLHVQVPSDIAECSTFRAATALTLSDMMDLALPIDPRQGIDQRSYR
jgi:hypothetical protein